MKKGIYILDAPTYHPQLGELIPGAIVDLPDDFVFKTSRLFREHKEKNTQKKPELKSERVEELTPQLPNSRTYFNKEG